MAARLDGAGADLDAEPVRAPVLPATLAVATLAVGTLLAGCSSDGSDGSPSADASKAAGVAWSPCDGLTSARVSALVGEPVAEQNGTTAQPRCTFTPKRKGGAAYDLSYLYFDGGLDAALDAMGTSGAQLQSVDVAGAEAARMVVRTEKGGVLVTAFVQTEGLVQSVNAAQVAPYDEDRIVSGTKALLAELAQRAPSSPQG